MKRRWIIVLLAAFGLWVIGSLWFSSNQGPRSAAARSNGARADVVSAPNSALISEGKGLITNATLASASAAQEPINYSENSATLADLIPELKIIADVSFTLPVRQEALSKLAQEPNGQSFKALAEYLRHPMPLDRSMLERERALKNDVLNALRLQWDKPAELLEALSAIAQDREQDPGLRDYALQHAAAMIPELVREEDRQNALKVLWGALPHKEGTLAGTALIGLVAVEGIAGTSTGLILEGELMRVLLDEEYNRSSRLTALALCAKYKIVKEEALKLADQWARDPFAGEGPRRAALHYLQISNFN